MKEREHMSAQIKARISYEENGQIWSRGEETFLSHTDYGDYLYRNADRIKSVFLVSIGETVYNCLTSKRGE
jgi:hypothetical protein